MRFRSALTPVSVVLLVVLSACGGGGGDDGVATLSGSGSDSDSSTDTTLSKEDAEQAMVDWTECMRGEGVDLPDVQTDADGNTRIGARPGGAGGGTDTEGDEVDGGGDGGADLPSKDDFDKAVTTCGQPPRQGGDISEKDLKEMQDSALKFSECMRDEGIEDFPDPDFSKMGPGAGPSVRIDDGSSNDEEGATKGPFGDIDPTTPEFEAAQKACEAKNPDGPKFRTNANGDRSAKASASASS